MSDCPYCDWRYDPYAECICTYPLGSRIAPVVYDGTLRVASPYEAPQGKREAAGHHICTSHPLEADVLILGPLEQYAPLAALNQLLTAYADRPWRLALGLRP
jgi:hypothetical protein